MPKNTIDQFSFDVDEEGFFTDASQWSEELATRLATLIDIDLGAKHLEVLNFARSDAASTGVTPTLRRMQTAGGFNVKDLFRLFPGKPAKKIAYLAGLRKPVGCV